MKVKQSVASIMVLIILVFTGSSVQAFSQEYDHKIDNFQIQISDYVENFIKDAYDPYYEINSIEAIIEDISTNNNQLSAQIHTTLNRTLKAKSVEDLPAVKGLKKELSHMKLSRSADIADAEQVIQEKVNDLQQYIGLSTDQNDIFRISVPVIGEELDLLNAKLELLNGMVDWVPATYFIPASENEMMNSGVQYLNESITLNKMHISKSESLYTNVEPMAAVKYDRLAARDYANKYTSEVTSSPYYNTKKWNPDYKHHTENGGVDCANYVSQAIYAGGIPQDKTWKPETTAWVNTGRNISNGLKQYMVDTKGYFYKTDKLGTSAGGFISAKEYSHVMFVVANDTVTMLYSAHTRDRLKSSFANFSDKKFEFFYINSKYLK